MCACFFCGGTVSGVLPNHKKMANTFFFPSTYNLSCSFTHFFVVVIMRPVYFIAPLMDTGDLTGVLLICFYLPRIKLLLVNVPCNATLKIHCELD